MNRVLDKLHAATEKIRLWMLAVSFSGSSYLVALYINNVDFTLTEFRNRAIGAAILRGFNPALREDVYFISILLFVAISALLLFMLIKFDEFITAKLPELNFENERVTLVGFSLLLFANTVFRWRQVLEDKFTLVNEAVLALLLLLIAATITHMLVKALLSIKFSDKLRNVNSMPFFLTTLLLPLPLLYLFQFFRIDEQTVIINTISSLVFLFCAFTAIWALGVGMKKINTLIIAMIPLFFIPVSFIVGNELQFTLRAHEFTAIGITRSIIIFLAICSVILFIFFSRSKKQLSETAGMSLFEYLILPVILATSAVFISWQPYLVWGHYDFLHQGNDMVIVQQFFQFGVIPFVDHFAPFGFSRFVGGFFYNLVNGYQMIEFIIWNEIFYNTIIFVVLYFILRTMIPAFWAFVILLFLPMGIWGSVHIWRAAPYYMMGLLPVIYIKSFLTKKRLADFIVMMILALCTFAWMPSVGRIGVTAVIAILLISCDTKKDWKNFFIAGLISFGIPATIYSLLVILRGGSLIDNLIMIREVSVAQFYHGGQTRILFDGTPLWQAVLTYGILPLFCVITILYSLTRKERTYKECTLLFIAIASIVSVTRSLTRHSLVGWGFDWEFHMLLVLIMVFYFLKDKVKQRIWFVSFACIAVILTAGRSPIQLGNQSLNDAYHDLVLTAGSVTYGNFIQKHSFHDFEHGDVRYIENREELPYNFIALMDDLLEPHQTFFEMGSAHMLHTLTNTRHPMFICSSHLTQSEPMQLAYIRAFERVIDEDKIPIVVLDGPWWGFFVDDIHTTFGNFKLSEFIYQHYRPWIEVDGYQLWLANNSNINERLHELLDEYASIDEWYNNINPGSYIRRNHNIYRLPYIWANHDRQISRYGLDIQAIIAQNIHIYDEDVFVEFDPNIDKSSGNYVFLSILSENEREQTMVFSYGEDFADGFTFRIQPGENDYVLRISSQFSWMDEPIDVFRFTSTAPVTINTLAIARGD